MSAPVQALHVGTKSAESGKRISAGIAMVLERKVFGSTSRKPSGRWHRRGNSLADFVDDMLPLSCALRNKSQKSLSAKARAKELIKLGLSEHPIDNLLALGSPIEVEAEGFLDQGNQEFGRVTRTEPAEVEQPGPPGQEGNAGGLELEKHRSVRHKVLRFSIML